MTLFAAANIYWHLPVLLVAFSLVYSGTRHDRWDRILWEAAGWAVRIGGFLVAVGGGLFVVSSYPDLWPYFAAVGAVGTVVYYYVLYRLRRREAAAAAK